MINTRLRAALVVGLMVASVAVAAAWRPTMKLADQRPKVNLEAIFPKSFGEWVVDDRMPVQLVSPDTAALLNMPDQMTFAQLRRYIDAIKKSGYAGEEMRVKLYAKTSWPFLSLVMALIALPFAFRLGKRGALYGVGLGLVLGILYWMIFAVFTKFGEVGNLPALLAAWSANILFALAALYMFLRVET